MENEMRLQPGEQIMYVHSYLADARWPVPQTVIDAKTGAQICFCDNSIHTLLFRINMICNDPTIQVSAVELIHGGAKVEPDTALIAYTVRKGDSI